MTCSEFVEASAVETHDDPGVEEKVVRFLELPDVFVSTLVIVRGGMTREGNVYLEFAMVYGCGIGMLAGSLVTRRRLRGLIIKLLSRIHLQHICHSISYSISIRNINRVDI